MIRIPSVSTLKKYGMSKQDYLSLIESQGGVCPVCKKVPKEGKFVIDHYHHRQYKSLPAELRRLYVRGALCWFDNYYSIARGITVEKARNIVVYLESFEARRPK